MTNQSRFAVNNSKTAPDAPLTIYCNGRIFTAAHATPWADSFAVTNGRLMAVGTENHVRQWAGRHATMATAEIMDLAGRFVMPGLCDSHIHLYDTLMAARSVKLAGCKDLAEMTARIAQHQAKDRDRRQQNIHPSNRQVHEEWLRGHGWNESRWPVSRYPTAADLESVIAPHRPAIFWRSDMHVAVCNRAALHRAGITTASPDPPGGHIGRDPTGALNGLLYDTAINQVTPHIPPLEGPALETAIQTMIAELHRLGITAIHDQRLQTGDDGPRMLAAYTNLHHRGQLPLRVHCNIGGAYLDHALALGLQSGFGDEWLRIGHVKFFIDGSLGSRTAWMLAPYGNVNSIDMTGTSTADNPGNQPGNRGLCVTPPAELRQDFLRAMQAGLAISVHAIGDRGNREVLDLFEELLPQTPPPRIPHRIEHAQILTPEDIPRLGKLNLTASVQPIHALDDIEIAGPLLGARGEWTYAFRTLAQYGARLAFGSDAPVADYNPLLGIHAAVQRRRPANLAPEDPDAPNIPTAAGAAWYPAQGVELAQALRAYTIGPAEAVGSDRFCGTLEAGKCADFVVLAQDPFALHDSQRKAANFATIPVEMTVVGGVPVYKRAESIPS